MDIEIVYDDQSVTLLHKDDEWLYIDKHTDFVDIATILHSLLSDLNIGDVTIREE
jgi:hypothetical protein